MSGVLLLVVVGAGAVIVSVACEVLRIVSEREAARIEEASRVRMRRELHQMGGDL